MMTPKELLDTMLGYLGFVVQIEETTNEGGNSTLQIYTEESRRLIGRNGETLEAIQFLLNRLLQAKDKDAEKVIVDCEHYRSMREDRIVQRVRELADRVRISGRSIQLEPMNSYERRLIHNAFKDDPEVATWSPSDSARIKQITLLKRHEPTNSTCTKSRGFLLFSGAYLRTPAKLLQKRIRFPFGGVRDDLTYYWRELESVSAIACGDN
ncbi:MAG: hypothetical protein DME69_14995 [Verrucomicrobia bacterium]|nr:MAG: hypothetical protein DME69_14995 [Verrucomicrobiota bacterium]